MEKIYHIGKSLLKTGVITCLFMSVTVFGQGKSDSTTMQILESEQVESVFEDNLDSMLNLWYVQNALPLKKQGQQVTVDTGYVFLPDSVYAARLSRLPFSFKMTYNPIVRKYIEMYTQRKRDKVQIMLGLADYYFPIFDDVFDYYGVPNEIKYMSIIESALNPRAKSRTRAIGLWQFMYGTAKRYDLVVNSLVDERRDPIKETHAAAKFSKDLYDIYGDWQLVVAAYNCGPGNVNKAIRRAGGKKDFWEIYRYLPRETRGHVPAFIGAAYLMNYYKEHNLRPVASSFPLRTDTIMIQDNLHLEQVAEVLKMPLDQLKDLNPQYLQNIVPARGSSLPIMLPLDQVGRFIDFQDSIFAYKDSIYFDPNALNKQPEIYTKRRNLSKKHGDLTLVYYTVKQGDNIGLISEWYNCRIDEIQDWNNMYNSRVRSGQKLAIYVPGKSVSKYREINNMTLKQKQQLRRKSIENMESKDLAVSSESKAANIQTVYYTVKEGDTLWGIAKKYPGISGDDLRKWNNISKNESIVPGQQLLIKIM